MLDGGLLKWSGFTIPLPLLIIAAVEVGLMAGVEGYRAKNDGPAGFVRPHLPSPLTALTVLVALPGLGVGRAGCKASVEGVVLCSSCAGPG
jgi:hypothetical protein